MTISDSGLCGRYPLTVPKMLPISHSPSSEGTMDLGECPPWKIHIRMYSCEIPWNFSELDTIILNYG